MKSMFWKSFFVMAMLTVSTTAALFAQSSPTTDELRARVDELERKVVLLQQSGSNSSELAELRRQIDVLSKEIESMKVGDAPADAATAAPQYGLGAAASKVYRGERGVSIGGYGEMLYENFAGSTDAGDATHADSRLDFLRAVLYTGYKFSDRAVFNSELEVEHAVVEGEKGEVALESAYLDFLLRPEFNVRAGLLLVPMGLVNEQHEPTAFSSTHRPYVEKYIIPSTWRENGVGAFGDLAGGAISYRAFMVSGLNAEGFSGEEGIREGRQEGAETIANDFGFSGRLDWHPTIGTTVGAALFTGNSGQGMESRSGNAIEGRVTLAELHADARFRGVSLRGLWAGGHVGDAREINLANGAAADEGVGSKFGGWYAEAGYEFSSVLGTTASVTPFVRVEKLDTQRSVPRGFERNPANDARILTAGVAWKPFPQAVVKVDYSDFDRADESGVDQFSIGLGYIF